MPRLVVDWPVAGLKTGWVRRVGHQLAVNQVANGGSDVVIVVHILEFE